MKNTRIKAIEKTALISILALSSAFAAMSSSARDIEAKTVLTIHTGEIDTAHTGKQCYFKVDGYSKWMYIPQSSAGETNCEIVQSAFNYGKVVSIDLEPGENDRVRFLCAALSGEC